MIKQKDMIYPETYYCAKCDNCGADWSDDYNGFTAFGDKGQMEDHLNESEWHSEDDKDYCPDCYHFDDDDNLVIKQLNQ